MGTQSFSNHVRVHPVYHYVAVPVSLALIALALLDVILHFRLTSVVILLIAILLHLAVFLLRDYAKKNQDRIIRMELRLRYFQLTGKRLEEIESGLSTGQLVALRFAQDDEFLELIGRPETKLKSSDEIKKQITQWNSDLMRI